MDGLDGAVQTDPQANLLQGQIWLFGQQRTHFAAVGIKNNGLATASVMLG